MLSALFAALLAITWRRWPDPLVDFGRDLYIPWMMNQGATLYRDIEHAYGPLTQTLNAVLFRLFPPSVITMALADAFLAALLAILIYRIALVPAGRGAAFLCTLIYIAVFAFGNYTKITNFNFISPFSHEATHGIILCLATLHAWQMAFFRRSPKALALAGFFAGLCFLTRAETTLAALVLSLTGLVLWTVIRPVSRQTPAASVILFCLSFVLPLAAWFLYAFSTTGNASLALRSTVGSWYILARSHALENPFYRNLMGLDALGANLIIMGMEFIAALLAVGLVVFLALRLGNHPANGVIVVIILFCFMAFGPTQWMNTGRSIPLLVAGVLAFHIRRVWHMARKNQFPYPHLIPEKQTREADSSSSPSIQFVLWGVLSLALLCKIIAHVQLFHYGFYLALPATLLLFTTAIAECNSVCTAMATRIHRPYFPASASTVRWTVTALAMALSFQALHVSLGNYSYRTLPLGEGADRIVILPSSFDPRGPILNQFLEWARQEMAPNATVAVLPEGVSLNFLSRHASSVRYVNYSPFEFVAYGEPAIRSEFQTHPPDYVVLVDRDMAEFEMAHFGIKGYGAELVEWVHQAYEPIFRIGLPPFSSLGFGLEVLKRKSERSITRLTGPYPERHKYATQGVQIR